jgi:hypothetical protein
VQGHSATNQVVHGRLHGTSFLWWFDRIKRVDLRVQKIYATSGPVLLMYNWEPKLRMQKKVIKTQPCMEKINYTTLWTTNQIHFWYLVFFTSNLELLDNILCLELGRILDKFRLRWKGTTIEMLVLETWVQTWNYLNKEHQGSIVLTVICTENANFLRHLLLVEACNLFSMLNFQT